MGRKPFFMAAGMLLGFTLAGCQQTGNSKISSWKDHQPPNNKGVQFQAKQPGNTLQLPSSSSGNNFMTPGSSKPGVMGQSQFPMQNNQNSQYLTTPHQMPGTNSTQLKPGTALPPGYQIPQNQVPAGMTIQQQAIHPPQNQLNPASFQGHGQGPVSLNKMGSMSGGMELPPPVPVGYGHGQPANSSSVPPIPPDISGNSFPTVPPPWPGD